VTGPTPQANLFINRELSWLSFNQRVLEQAADAATPLMERLKFAAISASNLDEFFMVRVAGLKRAVEEGDLVPDPAGLTPVQQLDLVAAGAHSQASALSRVALEQLLPALRARGVRLCSWEEVDAARQAALCAFFRDSVLPVLTPLAIDTSRPFPLLASLTLNLAVLLHPAPGDKTIRLAVVQVPSGLTRLVQLADTDGFTFVLLEDIIRANLTELFPGQQIQEATAMRLVRDAELELDDEGGGTHLEIVEHQLRRRRRSDVVRLEVEGTASDQLVTILRRQLELTADDVYAVPPPLDWRVLSALTELPGFDELRDAPLAPVQALEQHRRDIFSVLDERDLLLHHPYDSYDPVIALVAQAAEDPDVLAIKQTLYRTSANSALIASLQRAAERNKQVTVLVELTARFDEERNIQWARALEHAGAHVIYGIRNYKTHAKICLIVKRGREGLRRYVHLGTGNYNERTARLYTDFGFMTSSQTIAADATAVFSALTGYSDPPRLKKLTMAPTDLRRKFLKLIDRERRRASAGQPAEIIAKMNSLTDIEIIQALYTASRAGVIVRLNVRGTCVLRPGIAGASERIDVASIVDRFLEHSRVYYFLNGGDEEVYLASADWMSRNLDKRIELMFPLEDPVLKGRVIHILRAIFRDTVKARWLSADGEYMPRPPMPGDEPFRVQEYLQDEARRHASVVRGRDPVTFQPEQRAEPIS
jgi:polyphosphate kinase